MIEANQAVFRVFDMFSAAGGQPLANAGVPRWIATSSDDKKSLKNFTLSTSLKVDPTRSIGRFDWGSECVFILLGFDPATTSAWLTPWDVDAGLFTAGLAELEPRPIASALQVKQIVDAEDSRDAGYVGHSAQAISTLMPLTRGYHGTSIAQDQNAKIIYDFILEEAGYSNNWIDAELRADLRQLASLDLVGIPYMTIARSMLDYDQGSLFMALYRCLEALYAHAGANRLRGKLSIAAPWNDVAVALEAELNWRPIEWQSLESLVRMGATSDLVDISESIRPAFSGESSPDTARAASDYLYKLRNATVHYRPAHSLVDLSSVDWNRLCRSVTQLISYIYSEIFESI